MNKIKTLSELALEDENRFQEDERKQESKAFKIARERMKLKGEINKLKMELAKLQNENRELRNENSMKSLEDLETKLKNCTSTSSQRGRLIDEVIKINIKSRQIMNDNNFVTKDQSDKIRLERSMREIEDFTQRTMNTIETNNRLASD